MGFCSFCEEVERESYWKSYCEDCAMLRRMLVLHNPSKCVEILKTPLADDVADYDKPLLRSAKPTK